MGDVHFTDNAWEDYNYWLLVDRKILKRINELIKECQRTPFEGKGKPEPLRGNLSGKWSRRIDDKNRLVYAVTKDYVIIYECRTHYGK